MKFTVNTKALCGLLLPIARGVAAKSINSGETVAMTVDAQAGLLTVRCAIPAVDVVATIPVTGVESPLGYPIATPVGVLVDFLQQVDYEEVHISVEGETLRLHLDNADASACFPVLEPMHPEPRTLEGELPAVRLDSSSFKEAVTAVIPAAAADALRPQFHSVHVEVRDGKAELVCTDSRLMLLERLPLGEGSAETFVVNIPCEVAALVPKLEGEADEVLCLEVTEDGAVGRIRTGVYTVVFPAVTQKYPDYTKLLRQESPVVATVSAAAMKLGLNIAGVSENTSGAVTLDFVGGLLDTEVTVTCEQVIPDAVNKTTNKFACQFEGAEQMTIVFPRRRMVESLKAIDSQDLEIRMKSPRHPAFIVPAHPEEGDPERIAMLMPMAQTA